MCGSRLLRVIVKLDRVGAPWFFFCSAIGSSLSRSPLSLPRFLAFSPPRIGRWQDDGIQVDEAIGDMLAAEGGEAAAAAVKVFIKLQLTHKVVTQLVCNREYGKALSYAQTVEFAET